MRTVIRIGTRGSALAMYQAVLVRSKLKEACPMLAFDLVKIKTKGDMIRRGGISSIGRGIFTREIEEALLRKEIDLAVHSRKDLETELPPGLQIGAVLKREDPRDCLLARHREKFCDLKQNAKIGTSSLRRRAQLKHLRPDLQVAELRGNVGTRIQKLEAGQYDAIVMAVAGLKRIGLMKWVSEVFNQSFFLPQAGQGAIAIQLREDDSDMRKLAQTINHEESFLESEAERRFLADLHGGCQIPVGVIAEVKNRTIHIEGGVFSLDGAKEVRGHLDGRAEDAEKLGHHLASQVGERGGWKILDEIRKELLP